MNILCGDIGGTKTRLAILELNSNSFHTIVEKNYPSGQYHSLAEIIFEFTNNLGSPIEFAAFGVAGPVLAHRCNTTNLPWTIDARQIEADLKIPSVHLINDPDIFFPYAFYFYLLSGIFFHKRLYDFEDDKNRNAEKNN